ncbi:hypothetical protein DFH27DRAFT_652032 [Peziza echinospora]|nr:hypothetical protein DFH27DRAFT_652032 [Peziza echinospora]
MELPRAQEPPPALQNDSQPQAQAQAQTQIAIRAKMHMAKLYKTAFSRRTLRRHPGNLTPSPESQDENQGTNSTSTTTDTATNTTTSSSAPQTPKQKKKKTLKIKTKNFYHPRTAWVRAVPWLCRVGKKYDGEFVVRRTMFNWTILVYVPIWARTKYFSEDCRSEAKEGEKQEEGEECEQEGEDIDDSDDEWYYEDSDSEFEYLVVHLDDMFPAAPAPGEPATRETGDEVVED